MTSKRKLKLKHAAMFGTVWCIIAGTLIYFSTPATQPEPEPRHFPAARVLNPVRLTEPDSPFFTQQLVRDTSGKVVQMNVCYRDGRRAEFTFQGQEKLKHVTLWYADSDVKAFEAEYENTGVRLQRWERRRPDGTIHTTLVRNPDRSEVYSFHRKDSTLLQLVTIGADGSRTIADYADNGTTVSALKTVLPTASEVVVAEREVNGKKMPRLKAKLIGAHIASLEYFDKEGKLAHTAEFQADGSLLFKYNKDGKLHRRQVYAVVGEDWQRQYYRLREASIFTADGKTVEHHVTMHSNGMQKEHRRYDKEGKLEAVRLITAQMKQIRHEEFDPKTGATKSLHEWDPETASRGFVPDGIKDRPDDGDPLGDLYDFGGIPYMKAEKSGNSCNPLFIVK
ncbi:MAG: hypothetical protein K2W95_35495 [Candidatus Obscuribacterales bacterium]|nr:hypothetical protein [Candidatus Obscuribacterales bacterium]